jgi:MFS family permease
MAWASSFYLPSVLARSIGPDLGLTPAWIYGALSFGLGISALLALRVGHFIDQHGGRAVLCASNAILALGLTVLASAHGAPMLFFSWLVLGIGMAAGLYEPAFAALTYLYRHESRGAITGVTLIAGFASTIGWPTTAYLAHLYGWRGACWAWAAVNLFIALPLNAWALHQPSQRRLPAERPQPLSTGTLALSADRRMLLLAVMFTTSGVVGTGVATNMPDLLLASGASAPIAIAAASLMGPAQVIARVLEYSARRWVSPLASARVANSLHPIGAAVFALFGRAAVAPFAVIHGAGNGILTIAKGTLPLAMFGAAGYGARLGKLSAPARVAQAAAPFVFGFAIERLGMWTLALSSALSLVALLSLSAPALKRAG